jgi:hypothetical protein
MATDATPDKKSFPSSCVVPVKNIDLGWFIHAMSPPNLRLKGNGPDEAPLTITFTGWLAGS